MLTNIHTRIAHTLAAGDPVVVCTIIRSRGSTPRRAGSKMLYFQDGRTEGTVGGGQLESRVVEAARKALQTGQAEVLEYRMSDPSRGDPGVCGGTLEVLVEPLYPDPTVVVAGGGHVGKAVVELAAWLGWRVVLTDDRADFCREDRVPGADVYHCCPLSELPDRLKINATTYLVLTTRNVEVDVEGLPALLQTPAGYIGIIGSRRRWKTTRGKLLAKGISEDLLDRVVSPMGVEIGAETPEEIALSIMAEIVMLRNGGDGGRMGA